MALAKKEFIKLCICEGCPSYVECGGERAFCHTDIGDSRCIKAEKGCVCPGCPVLEKMGFKHIYYCMRGSEKEQLG